MEAHNKFHYLAGRRSRKYRLWYHRTHGNWYLWGIYQFMNDTEGDYDD